MWRNWVSLLVAGAIWAQGGTLEQAWALLKAGDRAGAMRLSQQIVMEQPHNGEARLFYGSLLSDAGQGQEAIQQLSEAVKLQPRSAEAQNDLGEAELRFGDAKVARACFEKALNLKPAFGVAHLNLGQMLMDANELRAAAMHLDKAIALLGREDDAAEARYLRAKVFSAQGDSADAKAQLEKAVAQRPEFSEAWSDLGQARKLLLDERGALAAFENAVALNANDAVAQYRLGAQELEMDQLDEAIFHLTKASELNQSDQSTLNALQRALRRAGRAREADDVRVRLGALLRQRDKTDQNALSAVKINNEGAQLEKAGDFRGACEKYQAALALNPEHVGIRVNYAVALLRLGRWNEGLAQLREALKRDPGNAKIQAALADAEKQAPK